MRIKSNKELFYCKLLNFAWKHSPKFITNNFSHKYFYFSSLLNGSRNKDYKIEGNKLEFIHLPKTGGTSIKEALKKINIIEECDEVHRPISSRYNPSGINYITCLREPISRVFSFFHMGLRFGPEFPLYREAKRGLVSFCNSTYKYEVNNLHCRYYTKGAYKKEPSLEEAINNVKLFKGVFIFEKLNEDFEYLDIHIPHLNVHSYPKIASHKDKNFIRQINKSDIKLYKHFSDLSSDQRLSELKSFIKKYNA
jgi:hypothetical protein